MSTPAARHDPSTLHGHALAVALLAAGALFMENLDATIIATGLPTMARDFGTSAVAVNVGITAYLLTLAVFIPLSGWMATRFGERRVFASAILLFTAASVLCALSSTLPFFTASRVLQGIGGSMMVPVGRLMVIRASTKAQLLRAVAYTIWPALIAPILGPPVGGWILSFASWPWMFLLNVPIGIALFFLALKIVRPDAARERQPFDVSGFLLVGSASFLLVFLLERLQTPHTSWPAGCAVLVAVAALLWTALWHLRRVPQPLFRLEALDIPTFWTANIPGSLFRMAVFSVPFLLPLLFQEAFGLSALASGSLTMAVFAGNLAMKPLTTPLLRRFGFRRVLIVNGVSTVILLAACGWLHPQTPRVLTVLVLFLGGLGRSMELTSLTTMGFSDLPEALKDSGTAMSATLQQMTTSLGIAVAALALHLSTRSHDGSPAFAFKIAFSVMAAFAALAIPFFMRLHQDAGASVTGATRSREREAAAVEG